MRFSEMAAIVHPEFPSDKFVRNTLKEDWTRFDCYDLRESLTERINGQTHTTWDYLTVFRATSYSVSTDDDTQKIDKNTIYLWKGFYITKVAVGCLTCGEMRFPSSTWRHCSKYCRSLKDMKFFNQNLEPSLVRHIIEEGLDYNPELLFLLTGKRMHFEPLCDACGKLIKAKFVQRYVYVPYHKEQPSFKHCCAVLVRERTKAKRRGYKLVHKTKACLKKYNYKIDECPTCGKKGVVEKGHVLSTCSPECKKIARRVKNMNQSRLDLDPETFTKEVNNVLR